MTNTSKQVDAKQLWENTLVEIELAISKANFATWFKDTHIIKNEEGIVYVGVPNQFAKEWLSARHQKLVLQTMRGLMAGVRGVEFTVSKVEPSKEKKRAAATISVNEELPLKEHYINRNDNLNPRYTFETFIVGPFNELAHAAAQAIVANPGITYNPFFVYGDTGCGKTHLMQAVGNQIKKKSPNQKVYYVTSDTFSNQYVAALQNNSVNAFKERYRQYDVFIMDDMQFLSGRERTQQELFHLFNTLYDNNKQVIFSSDQHPNRIPDIADRLKSRFAQGMVVDVAMPDTDSRFAILEAKARSLNFVIPSEIINYLASSVQGNIRDLEGVLNAVICQTQLKGQLPTITDLKELIKESMRPKRAMSTQEVVQKVANFYNLDEQLIYDKTRKKEVVKPRQLIMYILREDFHISYPTIGQRLGGRDHTTVIHSCEKIKNELKTDQDLQTELNHARTLLK